MRHEFLSALERAGCVGEASGWAPSHLILENDRGGLEGALPLYRKTHSWGEFVFDWSWARAWSQAGLRYYPKLVSMTPFTPATAPHLLVAPTADARRTQRRLAESLIEFARSEGLSSAHVLFIDDDDRAALQIAVPAAQGLSVPLAQSQLFEFRGVPRGAFAPRNARKPSASAGGSQKTALSSTRTQAIRLTALSGDIVFAFSAATFAAHGHEHYLNLEFLQCGVSGDA